MAAADFFTLTIRGRGGHAGLPHTAVDTIACAAELVGSLQHIVSRRLDPLQPAVVTIGSAARRRRAERDPGRGRAHRHDAFASTRMCASGSRC